MKKILLTLSVLLIVFSLSGCGKKTTEESTNIEQNVNTEVVNTNTDVITVNTNVKNTNTNDACSWIDESDIVIKLDLPEKYAHFNDKNIFPSYTTGFLFKSSYGDTARLARLAQKGCDYRVGFSQADFADLNLNPNYPLVAYAESGTSEHFTYENEPMKNTLGEDNLPTQGSLIVLKINGEIPSYNHYSEIFK